MRATKSSRSSRAHESATIRENSEIAHRVWDAASRGDATGVRQLLAPDIEWNSLSSGALSGTFRGPDSVVDLMARSGELVDGLRSVLIDVFANERGAVLHYKVSANRGLQSLETEILLRMRIEGHRIVNVFTVTTTPQQSDTFWCAQ